MSKDTKRMFGMGMEFDNVRIRYAELAEYLAEVMPKSTGLSGTPGWTIYHHLILSCQEAMGFLSKNPPVMADEDGELTDVEKDLYSNIEKWDIAPQPATEVPTENPGL